MRYIYRKRIITNSTAQDLIEKTQQNKARKILQQDKEDKPNRLAKLVEQNRMSAKKSTAIDLFKFNNNKSAKTTQKVSKSVELTLDETVAKQLLSAKQTFLSLKVPVNETNFF